MMTKIPKSKAKTAYDLLSEVRALILEEPLRYNQSVWLLKQGRDDGITYPSCGTIGCVAGWVATLTHPKDAAVNKNIDDLASDVLGLHGGQDDELFGYEKVKGRSQTVEHARHGAKHIAKFQKKYCTQLLAKSLGPLTR